MRYTKLNHLLEPREEKETCTQSGKRHFWVACGEPRASHGGNMFISLRCNRCGSNTVTILSENQYKVQKKIINNSVKEQEHS